jgi:predicted acetyltransferase
MNEMIVQIKEASIEQKPVLERLYQLYLYDFSEFEGSDVNQDGLFEYKYLGLYWTEPGRFPFLIYIEDNIAGFVLVKSHTCLQKKRESKEIGEFFVMRKYRRQGIGKMVAFYIFDKFSGKWEVRQMNTNIAAQRFWRSVIGEYTEGNFTETILNNELWHGPVQTFDNSHRLTEEKPS